MRMSHTHTWEKNSLTFYVKIDFYFSKKVHIERWKQSLHFQVEDSKESNRDVLAPQSKHCCIMQKDKSENNDNNNKKPNCIYKQVSKKKVIKTIMYKKMETSFVLGGQKNKVSPCMKKYHTTKVWAVTVIGTKTLYNIYRPAFCSFSPNTLGLLCIYWHPQKHYKRTLQNKMPGQSINIYICIYMYK